MTVPVVKTSEKPESWGATLTVLILFIISGLELIFNEIPHQYAFPSPFTTINKIFFIGHFILYPILLCIGWVNHFPRWSYPYAAEVLLFSWYMTNVSTPGFLFGRELWGWRAWIPLLIISVVALLLTRSLHPLKTFLTNIKADWTLLTFGLFGSMPLFIMISFDEMDRLYSLYFMMTLTVLMLGTTFAYMRLPTQKGRIASLLVGSFLTIAATMAGPAWYWKQEINDKPWPALIAGLVVYGIMFSPALIGLFHKRRQDLQEDHRSVAA